MKHWHPDMMAMVFFAALILALVIPDLRKRRRKNQQLERRLGKFSR